jgi:ferric-dicitrate binding protein FerR (iron transport regulator)
VILLDDVVSDTLAKQGGLRVVKAADGTITYVAEGKGVEDIAMMNSISTPRGGQYRVLLSDGTEVWLNASSSIRFPVVFTGTQRVVTITGEAYFEVAKTGKPFFVQVDNRAEVLVTGTKFNINAYNDESLLRTSLIEGQVSVRKNGQSSYSALKAGEQAELGNQIRIHDDVDMEEVLAWKNGKFDFGSEMDLKAVLRQVARWYDVDIVYEGDVTGKIGGSISRNVPASKVLEMIELTGSVQCRIEDKRVVVKPVSK